MKFEIVVCKLFQFGRVSNLSFGKELIHFKLNSSLKSATKKFTKIVVVTNTVLERIFMTTMELGVHKNSTIKAIFNVACKCLERS